MNYDIFNGDADGIIALLQLRLAEPLEATLVTGVKRDIKLIRQVEAQAGDKLTVLDISMEKNIDALALALNNGVEVFYADHHRSGEIPEHSNLTAHIDLDANTCTSLIVDNLLNGQYHHWAITAAYGDNLIAQADELARLAGLSSEQAELLKELGTLINYNGYGASVDDLHIPPAELFTQLMKYASPLALKDDLHSPYYVLKQGYDVDSSHLETLEPIENSDIAEIYELPCEPWARRISGVFGNTLANLSPGKAHAVLTLNQNQQDYTVSVRAPLNNRTGADEVCIQFATGGGRKAAAGINQLPVGSKAEFIEVVTRYYE